MGRIPLLILFHEKSCPLRGDIQLENDPLKWESIGMACRADTNPTLQVTCCQGPPLKPGKKHRPTPCVPVVQCKLCHLALTQIFKPFMCYPWTPKWSQSRADPELHPSSSYTYGWAWVPDWLGLCFSVSAHGDLWVYGQVGVVTSLPRSVQQSTVTAALLTLCCGSPVGAERKTKMCPGRHWGPSGWS